MTLSSSSKNKIFTAAIGLTVNLILFFTKLYIGLSVNSIAIYTDALNSLADSAICIAAVIGFYLISSEASKKYPFGTGKAEDLLSLTISAIIVVTGSAFAFISLERLMYPVPVWFSSVYAAVIAATAVVKLLLAFFFRAASKKNKSYSVKGFATDSFLDFFITLCTLISFTLSEKSSFSVDGVAGMIISIVLIIQGIKMTVDICKKITGRRDNAICEKAKTLLEEDENIVITDIQCHSYGDLKIFTADVSVKHETAAEIIEITQKLEEKLNKEYQSKLYMNFGEKNEK